MDGGISKEGLKAGVFRGHSKGLALYSKITGS